MLNYMNKLQDLSSATIKQLILTLKYQIRILGTEVVITRYPEENKYKQALGPMFNTRNSYDLETEKINDRFIINKTHMYPAEGIQDQPMQVYHYEPRLVVGDRISFVNANHEYTYKVERVNRFGMKPHYIYSYDLIGLPEKDNGNI